MTDAESAPGRSPSTRPARVVRFDALGGRDGDPAPVADFDDLGAAPAAEVRVASYDALAGPAAPRARGSVRRPDREASARRTEAPGQASGTSAPGRSAPRKAPGQGLGTSPPTRPRRPTGGPAVAPPAAAESLAAAESPTATESPTGDDLVPPDRPLPRGRRRGGRVGRLGPDAPDPERPEPEADPVTVAREICLRLLTDRARTRQELAQALARKGVPADAASAVLDRFDEVGLIDDVAFAGQWVRSRHAHRGLGRRAIAVELRRKGVADDVAAEALGEVDAESEARRARELVDRKLRSLAVDTPEQRASGGRKLVGMLARKGYGAGIAYRVVREALAEHGAEPDELGPSD
jgi:regulatory protein